ncbi:MAG: hypothetical protein ACPGUD_09825 [Parashewanella sp.]
MDLNTTLLILAILLLNAIYGIKAALSSVKLRTKQKIFWSLLACLFGPVGYYGYHATIPFSLLVEAETEARKRR